MAKFRAFGVSRQLRDGGRQFSLSIDRLSLSPGDRKALVGPSGCGKTTAMDLLALASFPDQAQVLEIEEDSGTYANIAALIGKGTHASLARLRAKHFGYVLQTAFLLPFLSVRENVALAQQFADRIDQALVDELLQALGLGGLGGARPTDLSVGQQQRVAVARSLAHRPDFLLADEPTAALDPASARATLQLCCEVVERSNGAFLMITHDADLARDLGFRLVPLNSLSNEYGTTTSIDDGSEGSGDER